MSFLGTWEIDDLLTFPAITHRFDTGALTDADSVPTYRVYEDETGTALLTGSTVKLDDANTTGFYSEQITLSAANGFEVGKCYTIYITAAVNSVTGGSFHTFKVEAAPATAAAVDDLPTNAEMVTLFAAADDAIIAAIAALNNLSAAQVKTQVVDALSVDTYAQPGQGAPPATASITTMLSFLAKAWRNKHTQDATTYKLFNDDAATVDHKAAITDDGTTLTRGEIATGP